MDPGLWTLEEEVQRVGSGGGDSEGAKKRGRAGLSYPYFPLYTQQSNGLWGGVRLFAPKGAWFRSTGGAGLS